MKDRFQNNFKKLIIIISEWFVLDNITDKKYKQINKKNYDTKI